MKVTIYEVEISESRSIGMKEMGTADLLTAFRQAGQTPGNDMVANMETKLAALRLCVVEVDGKAVAYSDLQGKLWDEVFSLKETFTLIKIWSQIHEPGEADVARSGKMKVRSGG